jgi:hypothetical protein
MMSEKTARLLLVNAGLYNILGILTFTQLFTSDALTRLDPDTFSTLGEVAIMLWGGAYLAVNRVYRHVTPLLVVFAVEKMVYVFVWARWLLLHRELLEQAPFLAKAFFHVYGVGDLVFGVIFAFLAAQNLRGAERARA